MFVNLALGFILHNRCGVDTYDLHVYVLLRNSDTSLLFIVKGRVNKTVILMGCFNTYERSC